MSGKDLVQIDLADAGALASADLVVFRDSNSACSAWGRLPVRKLAVFSERMRSRSLVPISSCRSWFVFFSIMRSRPSYSFVFYFNQYSREKQYAGCIVLRFSPHREAKSFTDMRRTAILTNRKKGGRSCTIR